MLYLLVFALLSSYADAMPAEPYLLYSNITNIHSMDLTTLARANVLGGLDRAIPLGIDTVNQHIYFGEHTFGKIYRANYDGTSKKLIMEGVENVEGVAIDWIGRNLYWTTYKSETIEVSKLDGKYRKVLINAGLEYPRGMAVDPNAGYLFWSDWGAASAIERCALDGTARTVLVRNNITWPNGVTLDYNLKRVYWIDAYHDTISSVDYNGNNRRLIFEDTSLALSQYHGFDLDFTGDSMYFTDWLKNAIIGVKISTGVIFQNITVPTSEFTKGAMGIRVVDSSKQQSGTTNCGQNNGGCEQLCFHKVPSGFSCACQLGMMLNKDGMSCDDAFKDEFLMFADGTAGKIYQMQLDSVNVRPIAVPFDEKTKISRPVALEYDRVEDRVYWTDVTLQILCRAFRNGTGFEVLFDDVGVADGLTIDPAGRLLYWTSTTHDTVEVSRFDGSYRKVLFRYDLDEPRDIIVDAIDGYIYWTDWGHTEKIERASMNGENRTDLVTTNLHWPNGLTIDHVYNKLYWADAGKDSIEGMDLTTMERKVILNQKFILFGSLFQYQTELNHPFGITQLHERIYWTDWNKDAVYSADVNTGANIVLMTANLGRPMDIHAYSAIPKEQRRIHYTFSFPNNRGRNFTCHVGRSCPAMDPPPACPPGYKEVRENSTCGLYCRDIVGYTYRCPCKDWMSCAVKERYLWGCVIGYYSSFRVRECSQVVRPGRCPFDLSLGSKNACFNDTVCPGAEKCCDSMCVTPATIDTHPCQKNNGGCDQLCFAVPGGYKCGCESGYYYDEGLKKCVLDTRPTTGPPTPSPPSTCTPLDAPKHGSVTCDADPVPLWGYCRFKCDEGFDLVGWSWDVCLSSGWIDDVPTCKISTKPKFSFCQNDTTVDTEPGKSYRVVNWVVPTAKDYNGTELTVNIYPLEYTPPVKFEIGGPYYIDLTASDENGENVDCFFSYTVEDREPPSFGSTCPANITRYTNDDEHYRLTSFTKPTATDNAKPPFVYETGFPSDSHFSIGRTVVTYTARDGANLTARCVFSVTIINVCKDKVCSLGSFCKLDTSTGSSHVCVCETICPQLYDPVCGSDGMTYNSECLLNVSSCTTGRIITVASKGQCNSDEDCITTTCDPDKVCKVISGKAECVCDRDCAESYDPVCGSDAETYDNECKLLEAKCNKQKDIYAFSKGKCESCSTKKCDYGAQCEIQDGLAKCECDLACADEKTKVCGSDGRTYAHKCEMRQTQCIDQRPITKILDSSCGCDSLLMNEDFKNTSKLKCMNKADSVECTVECQSGRNSTFSDFLNIKCYKTKWIRGNSDDNYVPLIDAKTIPRCYNTTPESQSFTCPQGYGKVQNHFCVPCPPGSYNKDSSCVPCEVAEYQDQAKQTTCKQCTGGKSSTTTGAESCYFDHGKSGVKMVLEDNNSDEITKDQIRKEIAEGLTKLCQTTLCTFEDNKTARRKRRATQEFTQDHVIIFSINQNPGDTEVELFVLDPQSKSLIPDKSMKSEDLKKLIVLMGQEKDFSFRLKSVDNVPPPGSEKSSKDESKSKAPVIAGVIIAILVLVGIVVAIWFIAKRRNRNKSTPPPVQFNSAEGGMHIGEPTPAAPSQVYENPDTISNGIQHGFVNRVYNDVHDPPPYYEASPVRKPAGAAYEVSPQHVYETPDGTMQAGALPAKGNLPDGAVVDIIPSKEVGFQDEKSLKTDAPMKFFHKRGSHNVYETPVSSPQRSTTPDAEAELRLEPPPKFDDAKLHVMREKAASSILPNVPRKMNTDPNANETTEASRYQNVRDVTKEQSES